MAERFSEMENSSVPSKATLEERLKEYLKLKAKIETMLGIIENACAKDKSAWRKEKQDWLKDNRWPEVLESLRPFLEEAGIPDPQAPVRACFCYLSNRTPFLDYKGALAAGLPIGSGEIECPPLCIPEVAQALRCLVEDGKFKKGDRSTRVTGEPAFGRLLEQPSSGSCVN